MVGPPSGEVGLETLEGDSWGAMTEFPFWQRVGMNIPGSLCRVSKDMQGTVRELPTI